MTSKKKIGAKKKKSTWKASSLVPTLAVTLWNLVQVQRNRRPSPLYVPTPKLHVGERAKLWVEKKDIEDRKNARRYTEKIIDFRHIPCYNCIVWRVFMVVSMTIKNADDALITALKSVCALYPEVTVSIKEQISPVDELKAEKVAIMKALESGTLKTFASMDEYEAAHGL